MSVEIDKDGNYTFKGQIAIPKGNLGDTYTVTLANDAWQPLGYISDGWSTEPPLMERIEKLERLVRVLADALGVNEDFLSSVGV